MERVRDRLKFVLPLTLFLIFLLLYLNTQSTTKTMIVLLAVPFSGIGAIWLLYLLGYNMSIGVWVGLIALMGVDAETGVFMLLYLELAYEERRVAGRMNSVADLHEAIVHGAVKRIRPKVMTVATMFVGLGPHHVEHGCRSGRDEAHRGPHDRRYLHFFSIGAGRLSGNLRGMEMAIGKAAICLMLASAASTLGAQQFAVHHQHLRKFCAGTLTVDESGIRFSGPKGHAWSWPYVDIQQLTLSAGSIHILSYKDRSNWKLGKDVAYNFTGKFPIELLERQWSAKPDQRFMAAVSMGPAASLPGLKFPVKQLGLTKGTQGTQTFATDAVVYDTPTPGAPRTWRYSDIQFISSANPFQLSITTLEKQFQFQLKQAITESTYNQLWLEIERKNGRIQ